MKEFFEQQIEYFAKFSRVYLATLETADVQPTLQTQIATARLAIDQPRDVTAALAEAQINNPEFRKIVLEIDANNVEKISGEAHDPELALLLWEAARGMALSALLGLCPLSEGRRDRLFDRLHAEALRSHDGRFPC